MRVAEIKIVRRLTGDGNLVDQVKAHDREGVDLPLTEALGMLRLAEDTLIREAMADE